MNVHFAMIKDSEVDLLQFFCFLPSSPETLLMAIENKALGGFDLMDKLISAKQFPIAIHSGIAGTGHSVLKVLLHFLESFNQLLGEVVF